MSSRPWTCRPAVPKSFHCFAVLIAAHQLILSTRLMGCWNSLIPTIAHLRVLKVWHSGQVQLWTSWYTLSTPPPCCTKPTSRGSDMSFHTSYSPLDDSIVHAAANNWLSQNWGKASCHPASSILRIHFGRDWIESGELWWRIQLNTMNSSKANLRLSLPENLKLSLPTNLRSLLSTNSKQMSASQLSMLW